MMKRRAFLGIAAAPFVVGVAGLRPTLVQSAVPVAAYVPYVEANTGALTAELWGIDELLYDDMTRMEYLAVSRHVKAAYEQLLDGDGFADGRAIVGRKESDDA